MQDDNMQLQVWQPEIFQDFLTHTISSQCISDIYSNNIFHFDHIGKYNKNYVFVHPNVLNSPEKCGPFVVSEVILQQKQVHLTYTCIASQHRYMIPLPRLFLYCNYKLLQHCEFFVGFVEASEFLPHLPKRVAWSGRVMLILK